MGFGRIASIYKRRNKMGQILNRRTRGVVALGTLADDTTSILDDIYDGLSHKAFLFKYRMWGFIQTLDIGDFFTASGVQICLIKQGLSDAALSGILAGLEITNEGEHVDVPTRQELFAIAEIQWRTHITGGTQFFGDFVLDFQPHSKGGIPFMEDSGWEVVAINRTGSALTAGTQIKPEMILERFAYEGGK